MIDPVLSLAFSLHNNKGMYALLLGSGVSSAAGIPTGWTVVLDLVRKLATASGEGAQAEPDPVAWYCGRHKEQPDYSTLLDQLAKTSAERAGFLRGYVEPNDDERARKQKLPTAAHRAIAAMVASGHVRVIVTTNFDRLLEQALDEVGVTPAVVASADAAEGALPLAHARCCVQPADRQRTRSSDATSSPRADRRER
jgi:NAD-dependent SIR2 family protein deacetylase